MTASRDILGRSFEVWYRDLPIDEQREQALLRARLEPVVEMMQVKGESECRNGLEGVLGGPDELCDFEKIRDMPGTAVYYARVLENPSCRWTTWQCLALSEAERPPACSDPRVPRVIQERAWTSPIWYRPLSF